MGATHGLAACGSLVTQKRGANQLFQAQPQTASLVLVKLNSWLRIGGAAITSPPRSVPAPEISAEPDGEIAFDWHEGVGTFSVSVGPGGVLNYAGLFGKNKVYGTEYWGDEIPGPIIDNVVRLYSILARSA